MNRSASLANSDRAEYEVGVCLAPVEFIRECIHRVSR